MMKHQKLDLKNQLETFCITTSLKNLIPTEILQNFSQLLNLDHIKLWTKIFFQEMPIVSLAILLGVVRVLFFINICANPVFYNLISGKFRQAFRRVFLFSRGRSNTLEKSRLSHASFSIVCVFWFEFETHTAFHRTMWICDVSLVG